MSEFKNALIEADDARREAESFGKALRLVMTGASKYDDPIPHLDTLADEAMRSMGMINISDFEIEFKKRLKEQATLEIERGKENVEELRRTNRYV